jgi:hypothetical protein
MLWFYWTISYYRSVFTTINTVKLSHLSHDFTLLYRRHVSDSKCPSSDPPLAYTPTASLSTPNIFTVDTVEVLKSYW